MMIFTYILIGLYAGLTAIAAVNQWKVVEFRVRSLLFFIVAIGILVILLISNKVWMFSLLLIAFILLHILAIVQGIQTNGRLKYSHHIIRFVFHCIMAVLVYKFI